MFKNHHQTTHSGFFRNTKLAIIYYPLPPRKERFFFTIWLNHMLNERLVSFPWSFIGINYRNVFTSWRSWCSYFWDEGVLFCRGFFIIFGVDALLSDDEPLWEPIEWSLVQTWLFFIFLFAWIGENLISSRYGSYVGRDKRVWFAWYKTFWLVETWYLLSYGAASLFVIVPFYYEITYSISFLVSWWDWYSRVFIFKFVSLIFLLLFLGTWISLNAAWIGWKKLFILLCGMTATLCYLFFFQVFTTIFAYFTDPLWYQKTRFNDFVQLSHEPNKWGWGNAKRDHFTYHRVSTVFWFKNDGPFAGAFLMINMYFLLTLFFSLLFWFTLLRKTYYTHEIHYTLLSYTLASLRQLLYTFLLIYLLILFSLVIGYWRFPPELLWLTYFSSWSIHLIDILLHYLI